MVTVLLTGTSVIFDVLSVVGAGSGGSVSGSRPLARIVVWLMVKLSGGGSVVGARSCDGVECDVGCDVC